MSNKELAGPFFWPQPSERDWPEDFTDENGNYFRKCHHCGQGFFGYKRRTVCKACTQKTAERNLNETLMGIQYAELQLEQLRQRRDMLQARIQRQQPRDDEHPSNGEVPPE